MTGRPGTKAEGKRRLYLCAEAEPQEVPELEGRTDGEPRSLRRLFSPAIYNIIKDWPKEKYKSLVAQEIRENLREEAFRADLDETRRALATERQDSRFAANMLDLNAHGREVYFECATGEKCVLALDDFIRLAMENEPKDWTWAVERSQRAAKPKAGFGAIPSKAARHLDELPRELSDAIWTFIRGRDAKPICRVKAAVVAKPAA